MISKVRKELPPLEQNGVRYEEIRVEYLEPYERRSGWMRARDIVSDEVLWEIQVYRVSYDVDERGGDPMGIYNGPGSMDCFFERFRWMPDQQHILIENGYEDRYLVNIHTREVRPATDDDFAPEQIYQRRKPKWLEPLVCRNTLYYQEYADFFNGDSHPRSGLLIGIDIKTRECVLQRRIYKVAPYCDELEHYVPESYFVEFDIMPGGRDLYISNQDDEVYFFDVRERKVWQAPPDADPSEYYDQVRRHWRARLRFFFLDIWDWITRRRY
ncbi:hypothetical protein V8J88_17045 [Massilia sp. W12]|uniref:hypothetical protein n=1 Tax=Massilia sp. W12 TaxID=3126507 RepID=UPI0030CEEE2D